MRNDLHHAIPVTTTAAINGCLVVHMLVLESVCLGRRSGRHAVASMLVLSNRWAARGRRRDLTLRVPAFGLLNRTFLDFFRRYVGARIVRCL